MPRKAEPKHKPKRVVYSDAIGRAICKLLASGHTLNSICKRPGMPHERSVRLWALNPDHPFSPKYTRAREVGYLKMADDLLEICDDARNDWMLACGDDEQERYVINGEHVQRTRLRVDTRKWLLSKALPKIYGDKVEVEHQAGDSFRNVWAAISKGAAA